MDTKNSLGKFLKLSLIPALIVVIVAIVAIVYVFRDMGNRNLSDAVPTSLSVEAPNSSPLIPSSSNTANDVPMFPTPPVFQISPIPTPIVSENTGGLSGRIIITKAGGNVPLAGLMIGLAEVLLDEKGHPKASGYEPSNAPRTVTDDDGRFVFNHLEPGMYTIILDSAVTYYQLNDEKTGDTIVVKIHPGEIVDLGELRYSSLPIPGFQ
uniref:Carboxypeptidase regulatory-like domain-containing protein n=1 Tax=Caldilinea aerophila TaxID=133453 RepID=A0A7C1FVY7_9CHLR